MKVINLLEKLEIGGVEYIDIHKEDGDVLCSVECTNRWHEFLAEKVLDSEVIKFSIGDDGDCGLDIYIKELHEKKHDDSVDSLVFAKTELDKIVIKQKSLVDEIGEIIKEDPDISVQVCFGSRQTHIDVAKNKKCDFRTLWYGASEKDILDSIKDLIRLVKEED